MTDGIAKGVGEQLGGLGKQIVKDMTALPGKLIGLDSGSAGESKGGISSGQQTKLQTPQTQKQARAQQIRQIEQQDEIEKQKQLQQARAMLRQWTQPQPQQELTEAEKREIEELEKKKKESEEERKKAAQVLPRIVGKRPRGDLYGIKGKQSSGEIGKNIKLG